MTKYGIKRYDAWLTNDGNWSNDTKKAWFTTNKAFAGERRNKLHLDINRYKVKMIVYQSKKVGL